MVREVPEPVTGPGEVLVRTVASGVNPVDWKTRVGMCGEPFGGFPAVLGSDLAGVVVSSDHPGFAPGDRVVTMTAQLGTGVGAWSDLVAVPASWLVPAPRSTSLLEAATLPLAGLTALQSLERLELKPGERLLVTGGVGAVGAMAVQLALHLAVKTDVLVSRPSHHRAALELGAEHVSHDPADLPAAAYDAVFDTAGVHVGRTLVSGGRLVSVSDDPLPDLSDWGATAARHYVQQDARGLEHLVSMVDEGLLRLRVATTVPVGDVRAAHEHFATGGAVGKVVLTF
jgi:NADPH:quinone reductase-like Zn-dependent oxidoreductase